MMKALALAIALLAVPAVAQAATHHHRHVSHAARAAYAQQREIACSQFGCAPVPRGCHREAGRTFGGEPTGFDIADCGNYTLYGNR
jgi:predicted amidohydrolase